MILATGRKPDRVFIPHESDQWMEFRSLNWREWEALSAGMRGDPVKSGMSADTLSDMFFKTITAWSYETPVSREAVDQLDVKTAAWAVETILKLNTRQEGN